MKQIRYIKERDELEIILQEVDIPEVVKLKNGVFLEFDGKNLSSIILPNFFQMIHRQPVPNAVFTYEGVDFFDKIMTITIKLNEQKINIKCDLLELEN